MLHTEMKTGIIKTLALAAVLFPSFASAQIDEALKADIIESGYIHKPLVIHEDKSVETFGMQKKILSSEVLCDMETLEGWTHKGYGNIALTGDRCVEGTHSLRLEAPAHPERILDWGLGRGTCMAVFDVGGKDWRGYNRLSFRIYPECEGARTVYLNLYVENVGEVKIPDQYEREGYHEINLKNNQWNECYIEIPALQRDKISCIKFAIEMFGKELTMGDTLRFDVDDVRLEVVENPETAIGWKPADNRIVFSTSGYTTKAEKTALSTIEGQSKFTVRDAASGKVAFKGDIVETETRLGRFNRMDFSALTKPGRYYIQVGDVKTWPFYINDNVWEDSAWRVLNFIFCERCGYPVPGHHGSCHNDLHLEYEGKIIPMNGGWHDAGDMSQQILQSGEISYSLFQMAGTAREKGNVQLYNRLIEEAMWGMDLVLRSRLGGGMRATGWGTNLWTDGIIGTDDDSGRRVMRTSCAALDNFIYAGIEAYAAMIYEDDAEMVSHLKKAAIEDFGFAKARLDTLDSQEFRKDCYVGGHTRMTSDSQYYAHASWSGSMLYKLTGDSRYAEAAAEYIKYTLACQCTEPIGGLSGFFYRNTRRNSTVHFNHQSRDYAFMEALLALCETQPDNPDYDKWVNSARLYGDFLKKTMAYVAPYGMAPSGVYNINEEKADPQEFYNWQVGRSKDGGDDYIEMLHNGVKLDEEHYLRVFPIWYSFKGNTACNLATGKAAALCSKILGGDDELMNIAEKQLSWVVGYNPFGQSLIYGEGSYYGKLYNALPGEMVGEIPVGMQAYFNGDEPYWPQFNTATYKEVWGGTAVRWMMLVSEF